MTEPKIIAETPQYFVIDKPPRMAVEKPSANSTLGEWLIANKHINPDDWTDEQRLGVVHRLDSDTSGVIIWARNCEAQTKLKELWQGRAVKKTYKALLVGECPKEGTIEYSLMRDNRNDRQKVAWLPDPRARAAITEYRRLAVGRIGEDIVSFVEAHPITGRTHQLRVHFKAIGHPIVGDALYGEKGSDRVAKAIGLSRQFLHAYRICLPEDKGEKCYTTELPEDLATSLKAVSIANS